MADGYSKLRLLGEGAYGRVFLAREKRPPRRLVCVKQLFASVPTGASQNEVRLMQRVRHPNVVRFFDAFVASKDQRWIVMEFCPGGDLRAFLRQRPAPKIHEDRVWFWIVQLCLALSYLHDTPASRHIWHRDLKTSNIFLNGAGFLVLGDLGVAREASSDLASTVIGTPLYMAPEIWDGKPYDGACDLWALGCTIYEMCTGKTPFEDAKSTPALIKRACEAKYAPLSSTKWSPRLRKLVSDLLNPDPAKRPSAAGILREGENIVHIRRYVQDRADAAGHASSAKALEDKEQGILQAQLIALGINIDQEDSVNSSKASVAIAQPQTSPARAPPDSQKYQQVEAEHQLRLQRERERHEQLRVALLRMQELRNQHHAEQQQQQLQLRAVDNENTKEGVKPSRIAVDIVHAEWRAPIQASQAPRPSSAAAKDRKRRVSPVAMVGPIEFSGIPRIGLPLTKHAQSFAAETQSPLYRDVRVLRKQESTKAAARYRATLDEKFNARKDRRAPEQALLPRRRSDNGDDDLAECVAQLENALRARLQATEAQSSM